MGTLYIDRKALHIKLDGNALAFYSAGKKEGIVPINPVKRVVIVGNVSLETPVLHRLADENISVIFLSGKRLRFRGSLHGSIHNNGSLRVKQYEKSLTDFCISISKDIVIRKVVKQAEFLDYVKNHRHDIAIKLNSSISTLKKIVCSIHETQDINTLRGLEGGAGASYFSAYTELFADSFEFNKRTRRPPEDPVNAMLSLCYTMLHFEVLREIETLGLDPTIGFYHQFEYGRKSLACDLVEPYRPDVDRFVYELFRDRHFTSRDFSEEDEKPGCYLKKSSRKRFYLLYENWAKLMRPQLVKEVKTLARMITDGQNTLPE